MRSVSRSEDSSVWKTPEGGYGRVAWRNVSRKNYPLFLTTAVQWSVRPNHQATGINQRKGSALSHSMQEKSGTHH